MSGHLEPNQTPADLGQVGAWSLESRVSDDAVFAFILRFDSAVPLRKWSSNSTQEKKLVL